MQACKWQNKQLQLKATEQLLATDQAIKAIKLRSVDHYAVATGKGLFILDVSVSWWAKIQTRQHYLEGNCLRDIFEFEENNLVLADWNNGYHFFSLATAQITKTVPKLTNGGVYELLPFPNFSMTEAPFLLTTENEALCLLDLKNQKCTKLLSLEYSGFYTAHLAFLRDGVTFLLVDGGNKLHVVELQQ